MDRFFRYYPLVLGGMIALLLTAIAADNSGRMTRFSESAAPAYIENLLQGKNSTGVYTGRMNRLDFSLIQPGDILLAGNPESCYGHFTHAGIYLGDGWVLEGYVDCGVSRQRIEHYHSYEWACILRVKLPPEKRAAALEYALSQEYKTFYPAAFKNGERYWNCTKLIWEAYRRQGVDLDSFDDLWIVPDYIYFSPQVELIAREGEMPI